jgi:hypothetical protein
MPEQFTDVSVARDRARVLAFQCLKPVWLVLLLKPRAALYVFVGPENEFPDYLSGCIIVAQYQP